jgi:hypothetical protein
MANNYPNYIRVAANVSDTFYLDEVKAVAFKTFQSQDSVITFVNNPANASKLFQMMDISTGHPISRENNILQANVVAYVTRDADDNPISSSTLYYTSIVTKNIGGYQIVQQDVVYENTSLEQKINIDTENDVLRQVKYYTDPNGIQDVSKAFDNVYSSGNQNVSGWISLDHETFINIGGEYTADPNSEARIWAWFDLRDVYTITKLKLWQHVNANHERYIKDFRLFITNDSNMINTVYYPLEDENASQLYADANGGFGRMPDEDQYTSIKFSRDLATNNLAWSYTDSSGTLIEPIITDTLGGPSDPTKSVSRTSTTGYHQFEFNNMIPGRERIGRYLYFEGQAFQYLPRLWELQIFGKKHT